ncbi:MAG: sialate O-acetylesterase [Bacteroidales bacterium]|nr:sialate O-acetylesterase [Bacteroidales bacterium]
MTKDIDTIFFSKPMGNSITNYNQIIIYGQSLSVMGTFYINPLDLYDTKTFQGGILTNYLPYANHNGTTTVLREGYYGKSFIPIPQTGIETQGKGLVKMLKSLMNDEDGLAYENQKYTCIINAPGAGGLTYWQLSDTITGIYNYYKRLLESVRYAKKFASEEGSSFNVPVLCYIQGEAGDEKMDTETQFYDKLNTLFTTLNKDIKNITGQANDVQFINYQIASYSPTEGGTNGRALAQLKLSIDNPNVHFGSAMYQFLYSDQYHIDSNSTRVMGAMMGVVAKRALIDKKKMKPIFPDSFEIEKRDSFWVVKLKMNVPVKPLVFDETVNIRYQVSPSNYGFSILKNDLLQMISSVTIINGESLEIFCLEDPINMDLTYAIGGNYSGGNLRDSQGDKIKIDCEGNLQRVDNWCPIFRLTLRSK